MYNWSSDLFSQTYSTVFSISVNGNFILLVHQAKSFMFLSTSVFLFTSPLSIQQQILLPLPSKYVQNLIVYNLLHSTKPALSVLKNILCIYFLTGNGRERGRETLLSCLLYTPCPGTKPATHVPWPGIQTFALWYDAQLTEPYQPGPSQHYFDIDFCKSLSTGLPVFTFPLTGIIHTAVRVVLLKANSYLAPPLYKSKGFALYLSV